MVGVVADKGKPGVVGVSALMGCADNGVCNIYACIASAKYLAESGVSGEDPTGPAVTLPSLAMFPPRAGFIDDVSVSICIAEAAVAMLGSPPNAGCFPSGLSVVTVACVFIDGCENEDKELLAWVGPSSGRLTGCPALSTSAGLALVCTPSLLISANAGG